MRTGQRQRRSTDLFRDDTGRVLVSALNAAEIEGRHVQVIRRACEPVACDVATGAMLWDAVELGAKLATIPRRAPRKPVTGGIPEPRRAK